MSSLFYVYCILDGDSPAFALLDRRQVEGVEPGEPLFALRAAGIAAAVSLVPAATFEEEPLNQLAADLPRLTPYALRHEQAIRTLFQQAPALIPLTFGAVYRSAERVVAMLDTRAAELHSDLDRLRNQEEWEVKLYRHSAGVVAALTRAEEPVSQRSDAGAGRAYLEARLRERRLIGDVLAHTAAVEAAVEAALLSASAGLRAEALDGCSDGDLEMIERFAALVPRRDVAGFRERVADLSLRYESSGFSLAVSGPWAPYSFIAQDSNAG